MLKGRIHRLRACECTAIAAVIGSGGGRQVEARECAGKTVEAWEEHYSNRSHPRMTCVFHPEIVFSFQSQPRN